jgi:hypothetical protein
MGGGTSQARNTRFGEDTTAEDIRVAFGDRAFETHFQNSPLHLLLLIRIWRGLPERLHDSANNLTVGRSSKLTMPNTMEHRGPVRP